MKIALLGDTHFGVKNGNQVFNTFFRKFYNYFFNYLKESGVKNIIQVGDVLDSHKGVNYSTLLECKDYFFNQVESKGLKLFALVGNHDKPNKNNLVANGPSLLFREYKSTTIIDTPKTILIDDTPVCMIPWICPENYDECFSEITKTKSKLCFGHFEITGFQHYVGHYCEDGLSITLFERFKRTFSGHFHHRSTIGNVTYIGTPYELTWQDHGDVKGFHIYDTDTNELTFIQNPYTIYQKIQYDDSGVEPVDLRPFDYEDCYIRLLVKNKTNIVKFEQFIEQLYSKRPFDIKISENLVAFEAGEVETETVDIEDTRTCMLNYIDTVETNVDINNVKSFMESLYVEALTRETV